MNNIDFVFQVFNFDFLIILELLTKKSNTHEETTLLTMMDFYLAEKSLS